MILREVDRRLVEAVRLEARVDVAGEGEERGAFGRVGEAAVAFDVERGELVRDVHQRHQLLLGELGGTLGKKRRLVGEARRGRRQRGQGALIVERLGGGDERDHGPAAVANADRRSTMFAIMQPAAFNTCSVAGRQRIGRSARLNRSGAAVSTTPAALPVAARGEVSL